MGRLFLAISLCDLVFEGGKSIRGKWNGCCVWSLCVLPQSSQRTRDLEIQGARTDTHRNGKGHRSLKKMEGRASSFDLPTLWRLDLNCSFAFVYLGARDSKDLILSRPLTVAITQTVPINSPWQSSSPRPHSGRVQVVPQQVGERTLRGGNCERAEGHLSVKT